ncbi:putative transcription factor C2H2 family [Helianthus anomalus]
MSNLIQETDQELMNHICVVCDKSFPSGRSLGGHMRSHVINSTDHHHHDDVVVVDDDDDHKHQKQNQKKKQMKKLSSVNNGGLNSKDLGYELRKDPKKTTKVKDASEVNNNNNNNSNCLVVLDKLCKECGKGFQSWKALFGHMKCHSEKVSNKHTNKNMNQDSWTSHSENENSGVKSGRIKKSRSRKKRVKRYTVTATTVTTTTTTITTASSSISMNANNNNNHASTSVVSEIEQDQESEIAMCLMMLSRDEGKWGHEIGLSDHCKSSAFVKLTKVEGKKPTGNGSKIKKITENQIGSDYLGRSEVGSTGLEKMVIQNDEFDDKMESSKRKFECITCNKSFHSYQALGGHKASHKKLKESPDSKPEDDDKTVENKPFFIHDHVTNNDQTSFKKTVVLGAHECPICFKVFSSGQALGGHKRSHMVAEAKLNQQTSMNLIEKVDEPVRESRGFIDLNMLPDTTEEDMIMNNSTTEYKPWHWVDTANHESTTLLGLLSTS